MRRPGTQELMASVAAAVVVEDHVIVVRVEADLESAACQRSTQGDFETALANLPHAPPLCRRPLGHRWRNVAQREPLRAITRSGNQVRIPARIEPPDRLEPRPAEEWSAHDQPHP